MRLKPAYVFTPQTLVRRVWMRFFPPKISVQTVRLPWGCAIEIDVTDTIGGQIFKQRVFDIGVSECAWRLLQPGDHVLDAGANIGYMTSLFAARVGARGVVHSFEPHPKIREKLAANIVRFSHRGTVASIVVHDCALGDVSGMATLVETDEFARNQGSACLANGSENGPVAGRHEVRIQSLDEVFPTGEFSLLKIDVEGHELKLIQGARQILRDKRVRHVIYEDHTQGKSGIPELFRSHGYSIYSVGHTLFGLKLMDFRRQIALDTSWESPSYLATLDPAFVNHRISGGWEVFRGIATAAN